MSWRDVLLAIGILPVVGLVGARLASETGLVTGAPPADALPFALGLFGFVFVVYVALTLRAIARATREILGRTEDTTTGFGRRSRRTAAVSDFAIHLDRSPEIDLRGAAVTPETLAEPRGEVEEDDVPAGAADPLPQRSELFGEVRSLLTRIPSVRQGGAR